MFKKAFIIFNILLSSSSCQKNDLESYALFGKTLYKNSDNKLWRHRVNKTDDANKYMKSYTGLELDVYYNIIKDRFFVSHDDDYNVNKALTLKEYFSKLDNVSDYYYWIDLKNLQWSNCRNSLKRMLKVVNAFGIKNNIIVESRSPKFLKKYNKKNIHTSYWVPVHSYNGILSDENKDDIEEIKDNLSECAHNALSAHSDNLLLLTEHFPDYNLHLWTNGLIGEEDKKLINKLKRYANVKVILVDYEKPF